MDAPPIQYVKTDDGRNIAFTAKGSGPPLVWVTSPAWSNQEIEWRIPEIASLYGGLADEFTVVRFDPRGTGASDGEGTRWNAKAFELDLEAIMRRLAIDQFALCGTELATAASVVFAAQHPDTVERLILGSPSFAQESGAKPAVSALSSIRDRLDPDLFTRTLLLWGGWEQAESRDLMLEMNRRWRERGAFTWNGAIAAAREVAPKLQIPTLILYREDLVTSADDMRSVAALIPEAKLVLLPGSAAGIWVGDRDSVVRAFSDFLDSEPLLAAPDRALQTVLFTDIEASTPLTQRLGDEGAQELLRGHNTTVRTPLDEHGGREVKHTGDGIMASFPSAVSAVTAALQIQRGLAGGEVRVRVGLNAGEPIAEDDDLFGTAVQLAARVTDRAEPGQVLVTRVVADLCAGKTFSFGSLGDVTLKGFDEAVELFEVEA